ncbi:MAG: MaoC family dehydratase [Actinomycetota bacterium]
MPASERILVGGPFFDDLKVGQVFEDAPAMTLTAGHAAVYQAVTGDRMRLPLDAELCAAVTGRPEPLAHPMLVCNLAIGQSTIVSQRVLGNLFYKGLVLLRPVFLGDTLRTRTEVVGLRQNKPREGRPATGMAALRVTTENQRGEKVLDFWRCPMLPLGDPQGSTGHADRLEDVAPDLDLDAVRPAVPAWRLDAFRERAGSAGPPFGDVPVGTTYAVEARDTVTAATELVRMTLNVAMTHTDPGAGAHGRRLVYGGQTISIACAQMLRALPGIVSIVAWRSCEHTGPVFEGDVLRSEVTVEDAWPLDDGGLIDLRAQVWASRSETTIEEPVLDWRSVALSA